MILFCRSLHAAIGADDFVRHTPVFAGNLLRDTESQVGGILNEHVVGALDMPRATRCFRSFAGGALRNSNWIGRRRNGPPPIGWKNCETKERLARTESARSIRAALLGITGFRFVGIDARVLDACPERALTPTAKSS